MGPCSPCFSHTGFLPFLECTKLVLTQGLCTCWSCCLGFHTGMVACSALLILQVSSDIFSERAIFYYSL